MLICCALCVLFFLLPVPRLRAAVYNSLTVEARLLTPISTYSSKAGTEVMAQLTTPLCAAGERVIPEGAALRGTLQSVSKVGLGLVHESASLRMIFSSLRLPDGTVEPVEARLVAIDNARERVDSHGKIHGIRATATVASRVGQRVALLTMAHPAARLALFALDLSVFPFPDPEIEYERGTSMRLDVQFPESLGAVSACPLPDADSSASERAELQDLVDGMPYWSYSTRQQQPMDLVNLVFTGDADALNRAFTAAGWTGSTPNSMRAGLTAIRAIADQGGYTGAPMRTLVLDGAEPEFRLQKSLNTFQKRDHLRIWKRHEELDGQTVWASAATRDLGATFGIHPFGFTHQIENDLDRERDKVVGDLVATGCVDSVEYVQRPETIRNNGEPYRRGVRTDARLAVVRLNSCKPAAELVADGPILREPGKVMRISRRVILTAKNHFLRDNIFWRTGDCVRLGYLALRSWNGQRRDERLARAQGANSLASLR